MRSVGAAQVRFEKGTDAFGNSLHGWGFNGVWKHSLLTPRKRRGGTCGNLRGVTNHFNVLSASFSWALAHSWLRANVNDDKGKHTSMMETFHIVLKGEEKQLIGKPSEDAFHAELDQCG